jgi:hypothetical protein
LSELGFLGLEGFWGFFFGLCTVWLVNDFCLWLIQLIQKILQIPVQIRNPINPKNPKNPSSDKNPINPKNPTNPSSDNSSDKKSNNLLFLMLWFCNYHKNGKAYAT